MRFLTVCKVAVIFDPHFERAKKKRLLLLTPTDDYENSDFYLKSDTPFGRKPKLIRLRRSHGMLHTGTVKEALTGVSAHIGMLSHTGTSRENVLHRFPGRRVFSALQGDTP